MSEQSDINSSNEVLLSVDTLRKTFGGIVAVDDASFEIREGEIVGLIGPNGAGKSTLFNLITGFLAPDHGQVEFLNDDITGSPPHRLHQSGLARTYQDTRLYDDLTVYENLLVSSTVESRFDLFRERVPTEYVNRAEELLDIIELRKVQHNTGSDLSFGQKKLVEFATLFVSNPRLAMLDEPCGGVNPRLIDTIKQHIRHLNEQGYTFFIIEHNMDFAMDICDRIIVLDQGSVLKTGTPNEVQQDKAVLDAYLGGGET